MSSVFISYSHNDKSFAKKLAADLRDYGHTVWIDETILLVGDSFTKKIGDAIDSVDYVAVIISSASVDSRWVQKELDLALNREIIEGRVFVLPILLNNVELPGLLKGKFYADFRLKEDYQKGLSKLIERLGPITEPSNLLSGKMAIKPYLFIATSSHGYLRIPQSEIEQLGILHEITEYSYKDDLYAYLEEDDDLVTFIEAKKRMNGDDYDIEKDSFSVYVDDFPLNTDMI